MNSAQVAPRSNGHRAVKAKRTKRPSISAPVAAADNNAKGKEGEERTEKGSCEAAGDNQANDVTTIRRGGRATVYNIPTTLGSKNEIVGRIVRKGSN